MVDQVADEILGRNSPVLILSPNPEPAIADELIGGYQCCSPLQADCSASLQAVKSIVYVDSSGLRGDVVTSSGSRNSFAREVGDRAVRFPVSLQDLDEKSRLKVERSFKAGQRGRSLRQLYKDSKGFQSDIVEIGEQIGLLLGDNVQFVNPGVKDYQTSQEKLLRLGFDDPGDLTDIARAGFLVKSPADADHVMSILSRKYDLLDQGYVIKESGYFDRKLFIRSDSGNVAEIQLWEPHLLAAKEGARFVRQVFSASMLQHVAGFEIPLERESGHALYERRRALVVDGEVDPSSQALYDELTNQERQLNESAIRSANRSWNAVLDRILPDSLISTGEAGDLSPALFASGMNLPEIDPFAFRTITAGRPSQVKKFLTSDQSKSLFTAMPCDAGFRQYNFLLGLTASPLTISSFPPSPVAFYGEA